MIKSKIYKAHRSDHAGNIVCKSVNGKKYKYSYPISGWRDKLLSFTYDDRAEECEYDAIGNPIKYRNINLSWHGTVEMTMRCAKCRRKTVHAK